MAPYGSPKTTYGNGRLPLGFPASGGLRYEDGVFEKYNVKVLGHLTWNHPVDGWNLMINPWGMYEIPCK